MSNRLEFRGLEDFLRELLDLPDTLVADADTVGESAAQSAAGAIRSAYPARTGGLKDGVTVRAVVDAPHVAHWEVVNTSPLAHLFEEGTGGRVTALGWNRGVMPAGHVFDPIYQQERAAFYAAVVDILQREGFSVRGTP